MENLAAHVSSGDRINKARDRINKASHSSKACYLQKRCANDHESNTGN